MAHGRKIAVIGLGYVGLPVAVAFARSGVSTIGFDHSERRIEELKSGIDRTCEVDPEDLQAKTLLLTADPSQLKAADFFIVAVPTPIDSARRPDLKALIGASKTVGRALSKGSIAVFESTVYPGATEEECVPILEQELGLTCGVDFTVGYSPERINPGDRQHRFESICKVVSGQNPETLAIVAEVYGSVVTAGVHKASSIKVAEAAKVIENTQRDLNIAFMNELSAIFHQLGIDTADVLAAAQTKWNFLPFTPGLVGGHCIGVDPYYLTYRAEKAGYHSQVILAGRQINDDVGPRIARECVRAITLTGRRPEVVTILGLTFKENVPDIRNSKVVDIVQELRSFGVTVQVHDPLANAGDVQDEYGLVLTPLAECDPADAVILAVAHDNYVKKGWPAVKSLLKQGRGVVLDIKGKLDREKTPDDITLWRL